MFNLDKAVSKIRASFDAAKEKGATPDELKLLIVNSGVPFSKVPAVYKELGGTKARRAGFRADFYEWLKEGHKTAAQVEDYVKENGSNNDIRHLTHYQGLAELTNSIHASK